MGRSIHDVLLALGAKAGREQGAPNGPHGPNGHGGNLVLDLSLLDLSSVFGGELAGDAVVHVSSPEAFAFHQPPELAACGTLWLPGVETVEALAQAIVDAHDHVRTRLDDDQQTLRRLGMKPKLLAPEPRARAKASVAGRSLQVAIDGNGDLVVELVDGKEIPADALPTVSAPDDADGAEASRRLQEVLERLEEGGYLAANESFDVDVDLGGDDDQPGDDDDDVWGDEESSTARAAATNATQHLSDEQLAELHAALDDSDGTDDGSDDDEAVERRPGSDLAAAVDDDDDDESDGDDGDEGDDGEDDAEGDRDERGLIDASDEAEAVDAIDENEPGEPTVSVPSVSDPPRVDPDEDEPRTITLSLNATRKPSSLLAELDKTGDAAPVAAPLGDADDYDEPTSSLTPHSIQTRRQTDADIKARIAHQVTQHVTQNLSENPLLARSSMSSDMNVDDFPALPADSEDNEPAPTSVNSPGLPVAQPPSTPPTMAVPPAHPRTSDEDVDAIADGFDDGEGRPRGPLTVENAEPATNMPTRATVSHSAEDDELPPPVEDPRDHVEDEPSAVEAAPPPEMSAMMDEDDVQTRAVMVLGALTRRRTTDEESGSEDPVALEARAAALEEEARALRERAADLRRAAKERAEREERERKEREEREERERERERMEAAEAAAREAESASSRPSPTLQLTGEHNGSASSLPVLQSMEVHEVDVISEMTPSTADVADLAGAFDDEPEEGQDAGGAEPPRVPPTRASDEGVSLAEVQAALGELASLPGEATQVGALRDGRFTDLRPQPNSGDGSDVFSTAASAGSDDPPRRKSDSLDLPAVDDEAEDSLEVAIGNGARRPPALADDEDDDSHEVQATAPEHDDDDDGLDIEVGEGTGAIGLVVEDAKARDRLRKHLSPRFKQLVEAPDASSAASLPEVGKLEAIVFVRPRPDDATRNGLELLCGRPRRPRILVISSDVRFDEMPEVSLRLPLGQRASEVAQQVVDGLKSLGVQCLEGSELE